MKFSLYTNEKVVVTGGAGFIGSHLVDALVAQGAQVTVLDNLSTGKLHNLQAAQEKITLLKADITDRDACNAALTGAAYVFHLAACVSVPLSMKEPEICYSSNIAGTFTLLEAARRAQVKKFIFSSSCAVYGNHTTACSENTPTQPTSAYGYSKLMGEIYCQEYARLHKVPTLSLRYFNVIGSRQDPQGMYAGVYAKFSYNMRNNLPITIFGNGHQVRDLVPVEQIVQANLSLAQLPSDQLQGQPINIATERPTTILELYHILKESYPNYPFEPNFQEKRSGDIDICIGNAGLYRQLQTML